MPLIVDELINEKIERFPEPYRRDIARAVEILKAEGCAEVYVFGSVAAGRSHIGSDIDLAVRGCPPGRFFPVLGKLLMELEHGVDLVDLDYPSRLKDFLGKYGQLMHVG